MAENEGAGASALYGRSPAPKVPMPQRGMVVGLAWSGIEGAGNQIVAAKVECSRGKPKLAQVWRPFQDAPGRRDVLRPVDRAVLAHLEARADPNPAPPPALDERQSARLAALRAEITLPPGRVEVLADERAAQTRKRLVEVRHVDGARVQLGAVAPAGPPAVLVDLAPS